MVGATKWLIQARLEVFIDDRWAFVDVTFAITVELPDGRLAEARELWRDQRQAAHNAYPTAERARTRKFKSWYLLPRLIHGRQQAMMPSRSANSFSKSTTDKHVHGV